MTYKTIQEIANYFGVTTPTIRRWGKTGKLIEHHRTLGNHRRFENPQPPSGEVVGYVRVSSHDQKSDLAVQMH